MNVVLWLTILSSGKGLYDSGDLWTRNVHTGCVPQVGTGDSVYLWIDDDGDTGGLCLAPRRRFMGGMGGWHVELARLFIDPSEKVRDAIIAEVVSGRRPGAPEIWWTNDNGPFPISKLTSCGWVRYPKSMRRGDDA